MTGYLLAIMLSSALTGTAGSIPLGVFTSADDCVATASRIAEEEVLQDQHDLWCIPVHITTDGKLQNL